MLGGTDGITIQKWYSGPEYRVEEFYTADGSVLDGSQVQQLVQAMAAFDPPAAGETELSPQMREQLEPVLAAAWDTQTSSTEYFSRDKLMILVIDSVKKFGIVTLDFESQCSPSICGSFCGV